MMMNGLVLSVWVICKNRADFPNKYTAREHRLLADGQTVAQGEVYVADDIESLRQMLAQKGLTRMPRDPNDSPVIVETWL